MATGSSIFLLALGAILAFAVDAEVAGLDITTVGFVLMAAGAIGLLVSMFYLDRLGRGSVTTERRVVDDRVATREVDVREPVRRDEVVETRTTRI